jgi:hypothetical protein
MHTYIHTCVLTNSRLAAEGHAQEEEQLRATALLEVERLRQVLREKEQELQAMQQAAARGAAAATEVERLRQVLRANECELQGLRQALSERGGGKGGSRSAGQVAAAEVEDEYVQGIRRECRALVHTLQQELQQLQQACIETPREAY